MYAFANFANLVNVFMHSAVFQFQNKTLLQCNGQNCDHNETKNSICSYFDNLEKPRKMNCVALYDHHLRRK